MKIWTSEHVFNHPWETVTQATWRKYPNPLNSSVVAIDVIDRQVAPNGTLYTHRLLTTRLSMPGWAQRMLSSDKPCFASEHSRVDPHKREMTLVSRNLTFCNELDVVERLTYSPHPTEEGATLLRQEAVITVHGVPLSSYVENFLATHISANANKGRQAMEHVIARINSEFDELRSTAVRSVEELQHEFTLKAETLHEGNSPASTGSSTGSPEVMQSASAADAGFSCSTLFRRLNIFNLFSS